MIRPFTPMVARIEATMATAAALVALVALVASVPAGGAGFRSFPELLDAMLEAQERAAEGVSDYSMDITLMGQASTQYFERTRIDLADGRSMETFRLVPSVEVQRRAGQGVTSTGMQEGVAAANAGIDDELERGMTDAGLPSDLLGSLGSGEGDAASKPWLSADPRTMLGTMAVMVDGAAAAETEAAAELEKSSATDAAAMAEFARRARIDGREEVDGRQAYRVVADDLDLTEATGDGEMSIRKMTLWIDAEKLVTLKMHMDGRMEQDGQPRDVFVERIDRDYRSVPGCGMYMPYSSVVRMGGVLGPKEQKELEQTRKQLADLDEQLASMPADQRQMMESRMGPQLAMMRRMVEGGAFEVETEVRAIRINTGPEGALASVALPGAPSSTLAAPAPEGEFDLVRTIQRDLERLGYDPGNTDGELTTETAVAISRFQAENGLDVTGEASPQLAGILSAKLAGGRGPSTAQPRSAPDEEALREAREACLQRKVEQARAAEKKKKRFGKLLSSVGRIAGRHGGDDLAADIDRVSRDVYDADATADDLDAAAEALGISRDDVAACQNPG